MINKTNGSDYVNIQIHHKDANIYMQELIDNGTKVDLILTDPPYNIGKNFGTNDTDNYSLPEFLYYTKQRLKMCKELLSDNGSIVWFCSHKYVGFIQVMMYELELRYRRMLIWHYDNGMSRQRKTPVTSYEPILWFSKSDSWTYNADDVRVPYKTERVKNPCYKKNSKGEKVAWYPNPNGALRSDTFDYPVLSGKLYEKEKTAHPTQKPEALIDVLLKAFCPKKNGIYDGIVFDPFCGSGTTAVCCKKLNLTGNNITCYTCELEKQWYELANKRLIGVE